MPAPDRLTGARNDPDALQCRPGDRCGLRLAWSREVNDIPRDVLGPLDDAPEGATVVAAGGDSLAGGRDGGLVAVDDGFEVRDGLRDGRSARVEEGARSAGRGDPGALIDALLEGQGVDV